MNKRIATLGAATLTTLMVIGGAASANAAEDGAPTFSLSIDRDTTARTLTVGAYDIDGLSSLTIASAGTKSLNVDLGLNGVTDYTYVAQDVNGRIRFTLEVIDTTGDAFSIDCSIPNREEAIKDPFALCVRV